MPRKNLCPEFRKADNEEGTKQAIIRLLTAIKDVELTREPTAEQGKYLSSPNNTEAREWHQRAKGNENTALLLTEVPNEEIEALHALLKEYILNHRYHFNHLLQAKVRWTPQEREEKLAAAKAKEVATAA